MRLRLVRTCYRRLGRGCPERPGRVCLVEANRSAVCSGGEVDELLEVFSAGRGWRVGDELEDEIEDGADVFGEVGDVGVEVAVVHGEETDLVVAERNELGEVGRADRGKISLGSVRPGAQEQFDLDVGEFGFDGEDYEEGKLLAGAGDTAEPASALTSFTVDVRVGGEEGCGTEKMSQRPSRRRRLCGRRREWAADYRRARRLHRRRARLARRDWS